MLRRRFLHDTTKVKVLLIQFRFFTSVLFYSNVSRPLEFIFPSPPFIVNEAIFSELLIFVRPIGTFEDRPKGFPEVFGYLGGSSTLGISTACNSIEF